MQTILWPLQSKTYVAGGVDTIPLRDIPPTLFGRIVHVAGIDYDVVMTPTYTTAPTVIGTNNLVQACDIWDGQKYVFQGGFNEARVLDYLQNGKLRIPDPDADTASDTARYFRRSVKWGPPQLHGGLDHGGTDYVYPAAALANGEVRLTYGALTDISADTTACTGTIFPYAKLVLLDEIRIPPAYSFGNYQSGAADFYIQGKALWENLALCDDAAMSAIEVNEYATINCDLGFGDIVPGVRASALNAAFHDAMQAGHITTLTGQSVAASDDNAKGVNAASPTALTGASAIVQPVLFASRSEKLTKLPLASSSARVRWTGSSTASYVLMGRVLAQPPAVVGAIVTKALQVLGRSETDIRIKTDSKDPYKGPLTEFMPWKVSLR